MGDAAYPRATAATILIIEHDEPTATMYARILELAGYQVRAVLSAPDALRSVAVHPPDAILVDFRMPVMDGLDFLRALRARPSGRTIPVAIVTGDYQLDERVVAELHDLKAEIRFKPLWVDDLTTLAHHLIEASTTDG
jgi:CheY-like chemotaxis protein